MPPWLVRLIVAFPEVGASKENQTVLSIPKASGVGSPVSVVAQKLLYVTPSLIEPPVGT